MTTTAAQAAPGASKPLTIALWIAQFIIAFIFCWAGWMKLTTPIAELSQMMQWTGEYPVAFVRGIGLIDLAGGIGILLPALTRIRPRLTVWAALGCSVLQVCGVVFHLSRDEAAATPLNLVLLPLAVFVLWGRGKKAPVVPRG